MFMKVRTDVDVSSKHTNYYYYKFYLTELLETRIE
jgi:hypothetical protein